MSARQQVDISQMTMRLPSDEYGWLTDEAIAGLVGQKTKLRLSGEFFAAAVILSAERASDTGAVDITFQLET